MADNKLLNVWALVVATVLASSSWGFQTNVDSEVDGADLTISKNGNDGGDLTVEGELSIGSVDTTSDGVAASIDITSSSDDDKLPTVIAVRKLKVPAFCASKENDADDTANASNNIFIAETEKFDTTDSYNESNGKFTAPYAGIYHFTWNTYSGSDGRTGLYLNGSLYTQVNYSLGHSLSTLVPLNEGDTVHLAGVGLDVSLMKSYGEAGANMFCGHLVHRMD